VRHEQDGRRAGSGYLAPTDIHDLLALLDGLGFFAPATPDSPNPAGTYCDLELNLKAGTFGRSWSGLPPLCVQLLARADSLDLAPFVAPQALLLVRPYQSGELPVEELPEWPTSYGFSLGQIPESGRWISGDVLAFVWEEVNRHDAPNAGFREGGDAYAVAVRVPGTIDQPFDCTLGWSSRRTSPTAIPPTTTPTPPPTVQQWLDIAFVDARRGWVIGSACTAGNCVPAVRATADGGVTWQPAGAPDTGVSFHGETGNTGHVRSLAFADAGTGWAYGPGLFLTRDGGATWTAQPQAQEIIALAPAGGSLWAIGRTCSRPGECTLELLTSTDKGYTWAPPPAPPDLAGSEVQLIRPDAATGWILSWGTPEANAQLFSTSDGGSTWQSSLAPCAYGRPEGIRLAVAAQQLWLLCGGQPGAGQQMKWLYTSTDTGQDWTLIAATGQDGFANLHGSGYVADLAVSAPQHLWIAMAKTSLYQSSDGGATWTIAFSDNAALAGAGVTRVVFADADHGWAIAQAAVYRTQDGGTTWERVAVP
jgi:photosystem II stability/assembly factor-like uncharacterized protein